MAVLNRSFPLRQMITLGGNAELELVDSLDPFSEGIIFSVMPPKKSWKNIAHLSGGEKVSSCVRRVVRCVHGSEQKSDTIWDTVRRCLLWLWSLPFTSSNLLHSISCECATRRHTLDRSISFFIYLFFNRDEVIHSNIDCPYPYSE